MYTVGGKEGGEWGGCGGGRDTERGAITDI